MTPVDMCVRKSAIYVSIFALLLVGLRASTQIPESWGHGNHHHHHHHHGPDHGNVMPIHELQYSVRQSVELARAFYENVKIINGHLHVDLNNFTKTTPEFGYILLSRLRGHVDGTKAMVEGQNVAESLKRKLEEFRRMNVKEENNRNKSSVKYLEEWYNNLENRLDEIAEYESRGRNSHNHHKSSTDESPEDALESTLNLVRAFKKAFYIGHSKVIIDRKAIENGHDMEAFRRLFQSNDHLQDTELAYKLLNYLLEKKIAGAMAKVNALPYHRRSSKINEMDEELTSEKMALEKNLNKTVEIMRMEKLLSQHRSEKPQKNEVRPYEKPTQKTIQGPKSSEEWDDSTHRHYYHLLGVEKGATSGEIRSAYKKKAVKYHPDKHFGKEEKYTKKMQKVTEAFQKLSDKGHRANYDWNLKRNGNYY